MQSSKEMFAYLAVSETKCVIYRSGFHSLHVKRKKT